MARVSQRSGSSIATSDGFELAARENDRFSIGVSHPLIAAPNQWLSVGARLHGVNDRTDYTVGFLGQPQRENRRTRPGVRGDWRKSDNKQLRIVSAGVYQGMRAWAPRVKPTSPAISTTLISCACVFVGRAERYVFRDCA